MRRDPGVPRPIRAILGVVALAMIAFLVFGWLGDYRGADERVDANGETTVTPDGDGAAETQTPTPEGPGEAGTGGTVVVVIEGLNFRREPQSDAERIRGLARNEELTHLETQGDWYHVRDASGVEGYVSANPQYTELRD